MPNSTDGKKRIKMLENNVAQVNERLTDIQADVKEIKACLLGDPIYKIPGMISEHKEMYDTYLKSRDVVPDIYDDYKGARWFLRHIREFVIAIIGLLVAMIAVIIRLLTE
jgi:hypothetical protein